MELGINNSGTIAGYFRERSAELDSTALAEESGMGEPRSPYRLKRRLVAALTLRTAQLYPGCKGEGIHGAQGMPSAGVDRSLIPRFQVPVTRKNKFVPAMRNAASGTL
jgi:hypothetical protein